MERQELNELDRKFRSFIRSRLSDKDLEDYDLVWQWEKFIFDKSQQAQASR